MNKCHCGNIIDDDGKITCNECLNKHPIDDVYGE